MNNITETVADYKLQITNYITSQVLLREIRMYGVKPIVAGAAMNIVAMINMAQ